MLYLLLKRMTNTDPIKRICESIDDEWLPIDMKERCQSHIYLDIIFE